MKRTGFIGAKITGQIITTTSGDLFELGTTIQVFPLSARGVYSEIKSAIKNNIKLIPFMFTKDWTKITKNTFDYVNQNGCVWHLWGHSWIIMGYR